MNGDVRTPMNVVTNCWFTHGIRPAGPNRTSRAQPIGTHRDFPNEMLVGLNKRDKRVFDVYRVDLKTGESKLDTENPGNVMGWTTDTRFRVRIAQIPTAAPAISMAAAPSARRSRTHRSRSSQALARR